MGATCRIEKGKKWALRAFEEPWFPERLLGLWRIAAASSAPGERKALTRAIEAAERLGLWFELKDVFEPRSKEEAERLMGELRAETRRLLFAEENEGGDLIKPASTLLWWLVDHKKLSQCSEEEIALRVESRMSFREKEDARLIRTEEAFVRMPCVSWTTRLGDAGLFEPGEASAMIDRALAAKELSGVLAQAIKEAEALGVEIPAWLRPSAELQKNISSLATAKAVGSDPERELESKACYAVYVDGVAKGAPRGFLNKKGQVKNDLGEACLFPSPRDAKTFASRHVATCFLVDIQASVTGCKALLGDAALPESLAQVMASRERREIGLALGKAEIEMLRDELARREREAAQEKPAEIIRRANRL